MSDLIDKSYAALLIVLFGVVLFSVMMLVRVHFVYNFRHKMLELDHELYKALPDSSVMMNTFWIWDMKKFIRSKAQMEAEKQKYRKIYEGSNESH